MEISLKNGVRLYKSLNIKYALYKMRFELSKKALELICQHTGTILACLCPNFKHDEIISTRFCRQMSDNVYFVNFLRETWGDNALKVKI